MNLVTDTCQCLRLYFPVDYPQFKCTVMQQWQVFSAEIKGLSHH
uniref:Uncharacterized protein n=1 Tax=Trichinella nativa TaxID=6335 RepID=A0A0V1KJE0_9BILA